MSHTPVRFAAVAPSPEGDAAALEADLHFWARVHQEAEGLREAEARRRESRDEVPERTIALLAERLLPLVREGWVRLDRWDGWFPKSRREVWALSQERGLGRLSLGADGGVYELRDERHSRWVQGAFAGGALLGLLLGGLVFLLLPETSEGRPVLTMMAGGLGWIFSSLLLCRFVVPDSELVPWEESSLSSAQVAEVLGGKLLQGLGALEGARKRQRAAPPHEQALERLLDYREEERDTLLTRET